MLSALLMMSLLGAPQIPVASGGLPSHEAAETLARDGDFEAALDAFRRIAASNPGDHDARLWIARLHSIMGNPERAEPVYRSVLLEDPSNVDAIVGAGMALLALGRTEDAIEMLERAEQVEPENPTVLVGLGRAHSLSGNTTRGVLYAERAASLAETRTTQQALEQARTIHGHRVELTSFGERFSGPTSDTGSVDLRANFRVREHLRVIGRGQHQRKFGFSEQRGGAGLEWRWRPRTSLFGQVLVGPEDNQVLPRIDVNGEIAHTEGPTLWVAGYRFFDFPGAQVSVVSPGVTWWPSNRLSLGARYHLTLTDFDTLGNVEDHAVSLRGAYQVIPRVWLNAGYAHGIEDFEMLSPDRIGEFRANTVSGGLRLDLPSLTSVVGAYEHQWRPDDITMQRVTISLVQRF